MDNLSKVMFIIWMVLAVSSFISGFYLPFSAIKVIVVTFGVVNMAIILSWVASIIGARRELKKKNKEK